MKCNQCGSEWSVNKSLSIKITKCPFCNSTIRPEVYSVKDGLRWIVDTRSIDVFLDENIISAILLDTVKGQEKDLKNLKLAFQHTNFPAFPQQYQKNYSFFQQILQ